MDWINLTEDGSNWLDLGSTVSNLWVPFNASNSWLANNHSCSKFCSIDYLHTSSFDVFLSSMGVRYDVQFFLTSSLVAWFLNLFFSSIVNVIWSHWVALIFLLVLLTGSLSRGAFRHLAKLRKANINFVMSVRPSVRMEQLGSHRTDSMQIDIWVFFENLSTEFKFY